MIQIFRTDSTNDNFHLLIKQLDEELGERYGEIQNFYAKHNKLEKINTVVLAFYSNNLAGCGCFREIDKNTAEIKRMYVKQEFRGKGISKFILLELEKWAGELKYKSLLLETGIKQHEAIGLYTKLGYSKVENYGQYKGIANSVCMQKVVLFLVAVKPDLNKAK